MVLAVLLGVTTMKVSAAEVRTGTLGDNGKVQYTYDESTKTLTLTGSDSGLGEKDATKDGKIYDLCPDVEKIVIENLTPIGEMTKLFSNLYNLKEVEIQKFDTSNVTNMMAMFSGCSKLSSLKVDKWNTANVTNMGGMFSRCENLISLDLNSFDTSKVINMRSMFYRCESLTTLDLSSFNMSKCNLASDMLSHCYDINVLHTPKVISQWIETTLPMTFTAPSGISTDVMDSGYENMILTREAISIVHPKKLYPGEKKQLLVKINGEVKDVSENRKYEWVRYNNLATLFFDGVIVANNIVQGEGTVTVVLLNKETGKVLAKCNVDVVPLANPVITTQPTDVTKNEGEMALFKVEALANNISYQWQYKPAGSTQWFNSGMTGSNTASLIVEATAARNDYQYRCVVKDVRGNTATTNAVKLTVIKAIEITSQQVLM